LTERRISSDYALVANVTHLFEEAQELLGTTTIRETVDKALRDVRRRAALRRLADRVREGKLGAPTPDELAEMRRNPHFP
jgi:Arc/MetJ family transcription regulator